MTRELKRKILDLFEGPTLSELATITRHGRPWVRYVMSSIDDEMTLRIPTRSDARKVRDINFCPDVHVLVGKNLFSSSGAYAQIEGFAVITADPRKREKEWSEAMKRFFTGPRDPDYVLIEVRPYRIEYWSAMEKENPQVLDTDDFIYSFGPGDERPIADSEPTPAFV
ncbi:MAG: pyridoxamine 5'-phosphate oxidase family protein [Planctomycetia bacterium]|nr:pyridoxamine 5'-phosphate oxidase family protein [Planctomycetia bacterium]